MLSRVADCIFWMSRYIERAENAARFVDVNLNLTLDLGGTLANQWDPLIYTTGDHEHFYERYGAATQKNALSMITFDEQNPNSIVSCLKYARENARSVREIIAAPVWEELNKFYWFVTHAARNGQAGDNPFEFFNQVKRNGQLIVGIMEATMSRGEAWHFAQLGRLLERADKTSRILDVKYYILLPTVTDVGTPLDAIQWSALLKSASALEMYRKRHGHITPEEVAAFLILDAEFPRALRFCLRGAEESLHAVTGTAPGTFRNQAERRLGQLRSELDYAQIGDIIEHGLHEFIDQFQRKLNLAGEAIQATFFARRPLAGTTDKHTAVQ
ncbi:MAG TPA: alpha-E domain-containing protein [Pirellulales bacterium]